MDNPEDAFLVLVRVPGTAYYTSDDGGTEEKTVNYTFAIAVFNYPVLISSRSFVNQEEQSTYGLIWNLAKLSVISIKDRKLKDDLKTHHKNGSNFFVNYYVHNDFIIPVLNNEMKEMKEVLLSRVIFGANNNGTGELSVDAELIKHDLNNSIWFYSDLRS